MNAQHLGTHAGQVYFEVLAQNIRKPTKKNGTFGNEYVVFSRPKIMAIKFSYKVKGYWTPHPPCLGNVPNINLKIL